MRSALEIMHAGAWNLEHRMQSQVFEKKHQQRPCPAGFGSKPGLGWGSKGSLAKTMQDLASCKEDKLGAVQPSYSEPAAQRMKHALHKVYFM